MRIFAARLPAAFMAWPGRFDYERARVRWASTINYKWKPCGSGQPGAKELLPEKLQKREAP